MRKFAPRLHWTFLQFFHMLHAFMPAQREDLAEKDDRLTIELEVVRSDERHVGGRPLFLNARRFVRICRRVESGESIPKACQYELVSYRNFRRHVVLNPQYQRRLKEALQTREQFLREFHIANIAQHAEKNVSASMFWLERRYPAEFALKTVNRVDLSQEKEVEEKPPGEVLARHRALLLELAREDEAKQANLTQGGPAA